MELQGKVALVTGAGSGIGRAAALRLAQAGAHVGLLGHTGNELESVAEEIRLSGRKADILLADVVNEADMRQATDRLAAMHGRIDVVFANAGINGTWAPIEELSPDDWDRTMAVNLRGTYLTIHCAVPHMKATGGSIVITSSINGTRTFSNPGTVAYATTKAGQLAMAQVLALELAQYRIRVNVVCPGAIETSIDDNTSKRNVEQVAIPREFPEGQIPLTRGVPGAAEDVGNLVLFLASDRARHITGTPVWIDGGQSLLI
ncbi:SDR family oxidoreductase [Chthonobacter albigriseus]|uniref:SDR family oxidoreductase n=1 Tax=Chthonobacter albigriseus TaxID=1683161 RepID=UPI0015EEC422|nr:SDR family NAD(P)-dependent oxidoreductase [Chthonobacter albigriseus]